MDLQDRRGIVTAAGSGMGQALTEHLGRRAARLLLAGRRERPLYAVEDVRAMVDLNLTAPILLTRAALPAPRAAAEERSGHGDDGHLHGGARTSGSDDERSTGS